VPQRGQVRGRARGTSGEAVRVASAVIDSSIQFQLPGAFSKRLMPW